MNGPRGDCNGTMYRINRMYDVPEKFEPLTCMYEMRNVVKNERTDLSQQKETKSQVSEPSREKDLDQLESRQERLFKQLEQLTTKLKHIKQQMTLVPTATIESLTSRDGESGYEFEEDRPSNVVVMASLGYNPITLMIICNLLSEKVNLRFSSHVHSSVTSSSSDYQPVVRNVAFNNEKPTMTGQNLIVTFIWKDVGTDPQLIVSPMNQGAISGEVNILRYFASLLDLAFVDAMRATQIDQWLDVVHISMHHGNNKERQGVLRTLNSHLGKTEYLVGERFSLADLAMLGALLQTQVVSTLQSNVKKWVKTCAKVSSVSKALNAMSIDIE